MKTFKQYIKEQEELQIVKVENDKRQKLVDLLRTMEGLNDEKFKDFAVNELGMDESEAETIIYKMLRDFLLAADKNQDGVPDEIDLGAEDDLGIDAEDDFTSDDDFSDDETEEDPESNDFPDWK